MSKKYQGLDQLLADDMESELYFSSLPDGIREHIRKRAQNVNSFESLKDYTENLLRGDN